MGRCCFLDILMTQTQELLTWTHTAFFCATNNLLLNARAWGHSKGKQVHFLNFLACSEKSIYIVPGFLDLLPLRM